MKKDKFKITFVYPDYESLGIEYLMALCLKAGHEVELVYYEAENAYLGIRRKEISFKRIAERIAKTNPDLVAFSCVTENYQYQLKCANALKRIKPKIATIFGGVHPTAVPKTVLQESVVDAVAIGEADISFIKFLQKSKKNDGFTIPNRKIKGIVFKNDGKLMGDFIEGDLADLDSLPFPYKEPFFPPLQGLADRYFIMTSRGCPYSCTYCFNSFIHKMRGRMIIRQRSAENVIKELLWAKKKYGINKVIFLDDSFASNKKWIRTFSRLYKSKIDVPFTCIAAPDYIDKERARLLSSAGCVFIEIGIQSLSSQLCRRVLNKMTSRERKVRAIRDLKEAGIMVQIDHMLGIPGDTIKNQEKAVSFYNQHRPDLISVFWLTYYPKTPIVQMAQRQGILSRGDIKKIEQGIRLTDGTFHDGGSMKNPKPYYSIQFLLNYLPFLPKWLIKLMVKTGWYKILKIRNFYISTALPRAIRGLFDKRYSGGKRLIFSFIERKWNRLVALKENPQALY